MNSNIQPWRLVFVGGAARNRLKYALFRVADHEAPHIPALPNAFEHYRYELGPEVYGSMGIPIADTARHAVAVMRNFVSSAHRWPVSCLCTGTSARRMP